MNIENLTEEQKERLISSAPLDSIENLVDYLYSDECKDYQEQQRNGEDVENHIFVSVEEVSNWLIYIATENHKVL